MAVDGSLNFDTKIDNQGFNKGVSSIGGRLNSLKGTLLKVGTAVGIAFGVTKLIQFGKESKTLYDQQVAQETKLATIMRQRMGASDAEIQSVKDLASEQQKLGIIGDEVQLSGAQQVATFLNQTESIKTLLPAMNNLLAQQKGVNATTEDAKNIGNMMGKVLQGQTSALKRVGISFTEAEEKVLKYGNEQQRSAMLAQVITNNVGEMNGVLAQTDAGRQKQLSNTLGDIKEKFGEAISQIEILFIPALTQLANMFGTVAEFAKKMAQAISEAFGKKTKATDNSKQVQTNVAKTAKAQEDVAKATKKTNKENEKALAHFDQINKLEEKNTDSNNGVSSTSTSTADLGTGVPLDTTPSSAGFKKFADEIKDIFNKLQKWFDKNFKLDFTQIWGNAKLIFNSIVEIAKQTFPGIVDMVSAYINTLIAYWTGLGTVVAKALNTIILGIKKFFDSNKTTIINDINEITTNFKNGFNNLTDFFSTIFGAWGDSIDRMRERVSNAISNLLTGIWSFFSSIGVIASGMFDAFTKNLANWAKENKKKLGDFFDSFQEIFIGLANLFGNVFNDIGKTLRDWWNGEFKPVWDKISKAVIGIGDTLMNVWLEWIYPVIKYVIEWVSKMWKEHLQPVFKKALSLISSVGDFLATLWNKWLKPIVDWLIKTLKPYVMNIFYAIGDVCKTVFGGIIDWVGGIIDAFSGILDFFTGVFSGNWKKAWNGIKKYFKGVWDSIYALFKIPVNLIIDGINILWRGIYTAVKTIVDTIGGIAGAIGDIFGKDWHFSLPEKPPTIPKLATGTVVPANYGEFLATLGDNKREPEIVSPLSTMKQAFKEAMQESNFSGNQPIVIQANGDIDSIVNLLNFKLKKENKRLGATI